MTSDECSILTPFPKGNRGRDRHMTNAGSATLLQTKKALFKDACLWMDHDKQQCLSKYNKYYIVQFLWSGTITILY